MKQLKCEVCGGTDLVKQDGIYMCQSCGCKYSLEEVKNLMIDVSGSTVKIDNSEKLSNLYQIARRARDNNDSVQATEYYNKILEEAPSDWEAMFFSVYYRCMQTRVANVQTATDNIYSAYETSVGLAVSQVSKEEYLKAIELMSLYYSMFAEMAFSTCENGFNESWPNVSESYMYEHARRIVNLYTVAYNMGNGLNNNSDDDVRKLCLTPFKECVSLAQRYAQNEVRRGVRLKELPGEKFINKALTAIWEHEPTYQMPVFPSGLNILECSEETRKTRIYNKAVFAMEKASLEREFIAAAESFDSISGFQDAREKAKKCRDKAAQAHIVEAEKAEEIRKEYEAKEEKVKGISKKVAPFAAALIAVVFVIMELIVPSSKYKKALSLFETGSYDEAISAFEALDGYKDSEEQIIRIIHDKGYMLSRKNGQTVFFGRYEQDSDTSNGPEEIEWIVLDKDDGKILVISRYALDIEPYHFEEADITWEKCSMRNWLNEDFLNTAFNGAEQSCIPAVTLEPDRNPQFDSNPGRKTEDRVFLLSASEALMYFIGDVKPQFYPTKYLVDESTRVFNAKVMTEDKSLMWSVRTPGEDNKSICCITESQLLSYEGTEVYNRMAYPRPALWICLD